jgi:hypothetical protein
MPGRKEKNLEWTLWTTMLFALSIMDAFTRSLFASLHLGAFALMLWPAG